MSYKYAALPPSSGSFRICILRKGERNDSISIDLITVEHRTSEALTTAIVLTVELAGEYEALSYQWYLKEVGGEKNTIKVDDTDFVVGRNLYYALLELRNTEVNRKLWIDAICIDQENIEERNNQVDMMESIYREAAGVLIWLGPSNDNSNLAMDLFSDWRTELGVQVHKNIPFLVKVRISGIGGKDRRTHESVLKLCKRSYWERVWIIQEVYFARKLTFYCGRQSVLWGNDMLAVLLHYKNRFEQDLQGVLEGSTFYYLIAHSTVYQEKQKLKFWLQVFPDTKCSDPRDFAYGLASLCTDRVELKVDYRKSLFEVYQDVIALCKNDKETNDEDLVKLSEKIQKKFKEQSASARGPEIRRISLDGLLLGTIDDSQGTSSIELSKEIEVVTFQTGVFQTGFNEPSNFQTRKCCDNKFSVPSSAKPGDWICLFKTSVYALVLRKTGDPRIFELVGRAFRTDKPPLLDQYGGCESAWTAGEFDRINSVTVNMDCSTLQRLLEPGSEATERRRL